MTGGAKFGADMLAYPGDPSLYHAQFTVRMVQHDAPLNPMLLKATARGSHAARKHSLLATIDVSQVGLEVHGPWHEAPIPILTYLSEKVNFHPVDLFLRLVG